MTWTSIRVLSPEARRDAVTAALFDAGSQGVHDDAGTIVTHFPPSVDIDAVVAAVRAADPDASVATAPVEQVDWTEAWKTRIGAHSLGTLTVAPPWLAEQYDPATTIVVDPGMAFGTGEHATTRGVVRLMQGVVRAGDTVADLGAGSAVLAIAAAKLGATRVAAVEMDPEAIGNAEANVARNGVSDRVRVIEGDANVMLPLLAPVRLILANIISSVLVQLLPAFAAALASDGQAILSGILQTERDDMLAVLEASGWRVLADDAEDIWWSVSISRP